jgi:mannitol-1-/sugar-/sorbitol-6-phosphatase
MKTEFPYWAGSKKAWLFDLDGTLIDSMSCIEIAWKIWCQSHGLKVEDVMHQAHGKRTADSLKIILPSGNLAEETAFMENLECELVEGLVAIPSARQLLETISGNPWAIVTSGSKRLATHRIEHTGIPKPKVLINGDDVTNGKPNPEGYLMAANRLNIRPSDCIVVEDAVAGVRAGKAAGMTVVAVAFTHSVEELQEADHIYESLAQLTEDIAKAKLQLTI